MIRTGGAKVVGLLRQETGWISRGDVSRQESVRLECGREIQEFKDNRKCR